MNGQISLLIDFLEQAYSKSAWHGTTLRGSIRNVTIKEAIWRPEKKQHNIREIIVHCAYWKYAVWRKIANKPESKFEYSGSDFVKLPSKFDDKVWKAEIKILKKYQDLILETVGKLPPRSLELKPPESKVTYKKFVLGIGSHDLYHAGQIQLIKRLQRGGKV